MNFTPEQQNVIDFIQNETGNLAICANAGTGKTSVGVAAAIYFPAFSRALAFNKSVQTTLASRMPEHVKCQTFHAFALEAITKTFGRIFTDQWKFYNIIKGVLSEYVADQEDERELRSTLVSCWSWMLSQNKVSAGGIDEDQWLELCANEEVDLPEELLVEVAHALFEGLQDVKKSTFDEWVWHVVYNPKIKLPYVEWLFVDECQDMSPLQHAMIARISAKRYIFVGDPHQQIYSFSGSLSNSFEAFATVYDCKVLNLTKCFRVPNNLLNMARQFVPSIWSDLPDGTQDTQARPMGQVTHLFRKNTTLLKAAMQAKAAGKSISLMMTLEVGGIIYKLKKITEVPKIEAFDKLAKSYTDRAECLKYLFGVAVNEGVAYKFRTWYDFEKWAVNYVKNNSNPYADETFCTMHRAKGLEWPIVVIHEFNSEVDAPEERNLMYVACTRAQRHLEYAKSS